MHDWRCTTKTSDSKVSNVQFENALRRTRGEGVLQSVGYRGRALPFMVIQDLQPSRLCARIMIIAVNQCSLNQV